MNFNVRKGEIFGFLGPSGAGKSTLEKIIIGLIPGYQGSVTVGGIESNHHGKDFYENIPALRILLLTIRHICLEP